MEVRHSIPILPWATLSRSSHFVLSSSHHIPVAKLYRVLLSSRPASRAQRLSCSSECIEGWPAGHLRTDPSKLPLYLDQSYRGWQRCTPGEITPCRHEHYIPSSQPRFYRLYLPYILLRGEHTQIPNTTTPPRQPTIHDIRQPRLRQGIQKFAPLWKQVTLTHPSHCSHSPNLSTMHYQYYKC
jgi:hypothetical protein